MQVSSTLDEANPAAAHSSRTWSRAFQDIAQAARQRNLWGYLGWQDIKQGYRRSVIGPLWITISTGVMTLALGILFGGLFGNPLHEFLPYVAVGLICWTFISNCINEGAQVFIANEGLIKHLPAPVTTHVFRLVWRQTLFFAHNLLIYLIIFAIFPQPVDLSLLLVVPALALLIVNAGWASLLVGIISTRFRDIPPITGNIVQLLFYLTPIVWSYETLINSESAVVRERAVLAQLNPFMHFIEMVRRPMLGLETNPTNWLVVGAITVVGWAVALFMLRNYRARVSYWV
ncbi:ABC transporter permease [Actinoalloteichus spitiensis]|uniref:galactan export ABC transporter permease subunit Wzm/RfbD n=1 Tax=Actinoalloteichus spitiensis TaxID=252394 RepID=UPI000317BCDB|nr:ABC transporter permease [Actinoalloteichus spitiensis]